MTGLASMLIFVGLFLGGGAYSTWKQKLPVSVTVLLALSGALALVAGLLRTELWT